MNIIRSILAKPQTKIPQNPIPKPTPLQVPAVSQDAKQRKECLTDASIIRKEKKITSNKESQEQKNLGDAVHLRIDSRYTKIKRNQQAQVIPIMFTLKADEIDIEKERSGVDLILVIDVSSSMSGEKIKLVKETLLFIIGELESIDRVSLVKFNSQGSIIVGLTPMTSENKNFVQKLVEEHVNASACTNINAGLRDAFDVLLARQEVNDLTSIFFLSDGDDTCGNSNSDIANLLDHYSELMQEKNMNYTINSFGYGTDHDEEVLYNLSNFTSGNFFYIKDIQLVDECFIECLGNLTSVFARNASIDIFLHNGITFTEQYGHSWVEGNQKQKASLKIGSIYAGMTKNYVCILSIDSIKSDTDVLRLMVATFTFNLEDDIVLRTLELKLDIVDDDNLGEINKEVEENYNRVEAAKLLKVVEEQVSKGNVSQAQQQIQTFKAQMRVNSNLNSDYVDKMDLILDEKNIQDKKYTRQCEDMVGEQEHKPGFENLYSMKMKSAKMQMKKK